jgi:hypothetical protein
MNEEKASCIFSGAYVKAGISFWNQGLVFLGYFKQ